MTENAADSIAATALAPANIQPTAEVQTLFADDFSSPLSTVNWDYNHVEAGGSFYGQTQQRQSLPVDSNGVLQLQLDTFNPTGAGTSFLGSEAISVPTFSTAAGGIALEVRGRIASPVAGLVGGFFGFNLVNPATGTHNELDTELLSNDAVAGRNQANTNVYSNDPPGSGHPAFVPVSDVTAFHSYRMEWFPDRVRWFVDGTFVREDRTTVPQGALALRLNIWVPDASWADAYSASLQPASSPGANTSYEVEVDSVRVARLAPLPTNGGRWVFSPPAGFTGLILSVNNGVAPFFPLPQAGAFNIEVFTNASLAGQSGAPNPDAGFQSSIADPLGTLDSGFLTGTDLRLTTGNFLLVDSMTGATAQSPSKLTLGSGNQTVVGARFDTLVGGSGNQIISALIGNETVVGGTGNASIWGGGADSIVSGTGLSQQIVVTGSQATVVAGLAGNATIAAAAQDTIISLGGSVQNLVISGALNDRIDLTGNSGVGAVIGTVGDTIVAGGGTTNVEGISGGMQIAVGAAGTTNISGSGVPGLGNTITGGAGNLAFNPSAVVGQGDFINLSGSTGNATINAFGFGAARIASHDTILAGNGADSVFGGDGDRIGSGSFSVVGGLHQWLHADTVAGTAVGFGSNDTVASTTYDTVSRIATRGSAPGTSSAYVTVGGFNTQTDYLFYQNESGATTAAIIATAQSTLVGGLASVIITQSDGTIMTLVGITQAQLTPALFKP